MNTIIKPTVNRSIWYWPTLEDRRVHSLGLDLTQPLAAHICYVWSDRMVNVSVLDANGVQHARTSVALLQGDESYVPGQSHCTWMPYQVGQAALNHAGQVEAVEKEIRDVKPNTVTMQGILDKITGATYHLLPNGRTTVCQLTLTNGYTVEGLSACVDIANYNRALGEKYAYEDALRKVWPLEGYLLAERLQ